MPLLHRQPRWQNINAVSRATRDGYTDGKDGLEFHNWKHAERVADQSWELTAMLAARGTLLNRYAVQLAAYGHDAYYWLKPGVDHPYRSRETYSASVTRGVARFLRAPHGLEELASEAVKSTELGVACASLEARCLRRADLWTMYQGTVRDVVAGTFQIHRENLRLAGTATNGAPLALGPLAHTAAVSYDVLSKYNEEDVSLFRGEQDEAGLSPNTRAGILIAALQPGLFEDLVLQSPDFSDQIDPKSL